ncbi:helix-turn-helix transcriptional regulator [Cupriavidus sp. USMAHM13]|uniref:helix-turn-helix transcriptional regulator n=1 Tax=Cupriavidus sp. USMAHM13 TaxID=1389192 RepID=UPI0018D336AB|nr:hypothetical protein [Cupriavidus sp. USMAHM13]
MAASADTHPRLQSATRAMHAPGQFQGQAGNHRIAIAQFCDGLQQRMQVPAVSPEMAVRLEIAFGKSAESWLAHQAAYDLWLVEQRRGELHVHPLKHAA